MTSKTPWILLRGLARESKHWGEFLPQFRKSQAPAEVHAIDLPGTGIYNHKSSPWTIAAIVQSVRMDLRQRGINGPFRLLAVSLGGMVALHWAQIAPEEVDCFVIANTSDGHSSPTQRLRPAIWLDFLQAVHYRDRFLRERQILKMICNTPASVEARAHEWAAIAEQQPMARLVAVAQLVAASRFRAQETITPPGLFLSSLGDRLVDPSCTLVLSQLLRRPLVTHPWAGHDLTLDDPQWVTQSVRDFMRT
jgi:pimeloyl-[acyl-carrier protein] methyl ester esterase